MLLNLLLAITLHHAHTPAELEQGLMGVKELGPDEGMLFHFPDSKERFFWAYGCYLDLDVAFLDEEGIILSIEELKAYPEERSQWFFIEHAVRSKGPAAQVLEMPVGWFSRNGYLPGDQLDFLQ